MPAFLKALSHRNYRIFWFGMAISQTGLWMQTIAMSWLTYRLTGSVFMLGVVAFSSQIPVLFLAPVGGLLADRFNRRKLMMATQAIALCQAGTLAALTLLGWIEPWHLIALSLLLGTIYAVDTPVRQSMAARLIDDPRDLANAITWNGLAFNLSRLVGPAIGGIVVAAFGEGVSFSINVLTYACAIGLLARLRMVEGSRARATGALAAGFRHALGTPAMRVLLAMSAAIAMGTLPFTVLLPYFAKDVFGGNADTLGLLTSALSVGGLMAAMYSLWRRTVARLPKYIARASVVIGLALVLLPYMPSLWLAAVILAVAGSCNFLVGNSLTTLVQTLVPDALRGRIMSLFTLCWTGLIPVGSLAVGALAEAIGADHAVGLCGVVAVICGVLFRRAFPLFRKVLRDDGLDVGA
jgi:MFS family permease